MKQQPPIVVIAEFRDKKSQISSLPKRTQAKLADERKSKGLPINKMSNRRLSLAGSTASRYCISTLKNGAGLSLYELSAGCYEFSHKSLPHFLRKVPYRF